MISHQRLISCVWNVTLEKSIINIKRKIVRRMCQKWTRVVGNCECVGNDDTIDNVNIQFLREEALTGIIIYILLYIIEAYNATLAFGIIMKYSTAENASYNIRGFKRAWRENSGCIGRNADENRKAQLIRLPLFLSSGIDNSSAPAKPNS